MEKVIFLGIMFTEQGISDAYKFCRKGVQYAPHVFQKNLLGGFVENEVDITVFSVPPIGSCPFNYKKLFIKQVDCDNQHQVGYINLPVVKKFIQQKKLYKQIKAIVKDGKECSIVIYYTYKPFLKVAKRIKKEYPNVKVVLIQTDAIQGRGDMDKYMTRHRIREGNKLVELASAIDGFVLLTKHLKDVLEVGDRPYIVMESVCKVSCEKTQTNTTSKNVCLYTGSINKVFGILDLAKAFTQIDNSELWICGAGDTQRELSQLSKKYNNIKFFGYVEHEVVEKLQSQCDFLINPRRPTGSYTKYSFPSKTVEYMITGKPVIMYKLEGVPDEYDEYLNYLSAENPNGIAIQLKEIFNQDYEQLISKANKAQEFVIENKNPKAQAKRIMDLIKDINIR